ncbi:MAG: capsule assembly Wzi family protein [Chitinophagaceae bacterium]|jgi:hypothetical protein|nr:capsule assembly Wzi family protein [Chitinophagaceae bacterium]
MKQITKISIIFFLSCFIKITSFAQINEQYQFATDYIYRMSQKGMVDIQDYILPLSRFEISKALNIIKQNHTQQLSSIEKKELDFLLQEFYIDKLIENDTTSKITKFKKDGGNRWRLFNALANKNSFSIDPIFGSSYSIFSNSTTNRRSFGGARLYGNIGKNVGFNLSFADVTETGDSTNATKEFTNETGIINTSAVAGKLNYSQLNFNIGYRFKNGQLSIGKDQLNWGYGQAGKIILSSKAPSFPYIKFDYQPFKWMKFNYFNAWLNSNLIDSTRSYNTNSGINGSFREVFIPKFMALHSISVMPFKGIDISVGESIIYSDRLDIGYLIPFNLFKLYDQYISGYKFNGGSNAQLFAQISSRNNIKNTHLYFNLFIDELRVSTMFSETESRNQLGYTIGINKTDLFVNYLTIGAEYTRINPFVYKNFIPVQNYENADYTLGDWMGNNADRWLIYANFTPIPKLKTSVSFQHIRKGAPGTLDQQYTSSIQPKFLFEKLFEETSINCLLTYEYLNRLKFTLQANFNRRVFETSTLSTQNRNAISLGFSYGL